MKAKIVIPLIIFIVLLIKFVLSIIAMVGYEAPAGFEGMVETINMFADIVMWAMFAQWFLHVCFFASKRIGKIVLQYSTNVVIIVAMLRSLYSIIYPFFKINTDGWVVAISILEIALWITTLAFVIRAWGLGFSTSSSSNHHHHKHKKKEKYYTAMDEFARKVMNTNPYK